MSDPITPPPAAPPPAAPPAPSVPPTVPLTVEEYQRLRGLESQLQNYQQQEADRAAQAEAEWLEVLAEKEGAARALEEQRMQADVRYTEAQSRYTSLETQIQGERKNVVLTEALASRTFVGETPEQKAQSQAMVRRMLQDDFETTRDASGALVVREKITGRPAEAVLKEKLNQWPLTQFFAADTKGGSGAAGALGNGSPPPVDESMRGSLGEIVKNWQARQAQYGSMGLRGTSGK